MGNDPELDRLKAAQDLAFQRQRDAWEAQNSAWERRSQARDEMNRAFEARQSAYESQNSMWEYYQRVRSSNGPRIDQLRSQQETAFQNMGRAFDNASAAHARRDGAAAKQYSNEGHAYKATAQDCTAERRRLVAEIQNARAQHDATKPAFQQAKAWFDDAKRRFDAAKAEHERLQGNFKRAKAEAESAKKAFSSRLEKVKADNKRKRDDKKDIARRAGVPSQYLDNLWVSTASDGTVNIYFGGMGAANGPGHGHYAVDRNGKVTYRRDPFDPHGAQNFTDAQRDYHDIIGAEAMRGGEFGLRCRFRGYDAYVESNTNRQGRAKIDIYYGPNGPFGPGHHHAVAYRETPFDFVADEIRG